MDLYKSGAKYWQEAIDNKNTYFQKYYELIESIVVEQEARYKTEEERVKQLPEDVEDRGYTKEEYLGDLGYEHYEFEQLLFKSFTISVFVFIESKLSNLCDHICKTQQEKFSYRELKGSGITRSINYVEKITRQDFPIDPNNKLDLEIAKIIRNVIVHSDGTVNENEVQKAQNYLKTKPFFEISDKLEITLSKEYCQEMILLNEKIIAEVSTLTRLPHNKF